MGIEREAGWSRNVSVPQTYAKRHRNKLHRWIKVQVGRTHALCWMSRIRTLMVPTSVQFNNGPVKYEIPFINISLSIFLVWQLFIVWLNKRGVAWSNTFGFIELGKKSIFFSPFDHTTTHRRMLSSIPSLFLSNSSLYHAWQAENSSCWWSHSRGIESLFVRYRNETVRLFLVISTVSNWKKQFRLYTHEDLEEGSRPWISRWHIVWIKQCFRDDWRRFGGRLEKGAMSQGNRDDWNPK